MRMSSYLPRLRPFPSYHIACEEDSPEAARRLSTAAQGQLWRHSGAVWTDQYVSAQYSHALRIATQHFAGGTMRIKVKNLTRSLLELAL